jgi:C1A family cysteine protease
MKSIFDIFRKKSQKYSFGYIRDKWDDRDYYYKARMFVGLPATTERKNINAFNIRYDQGQIGSCVANGICYAFRRVLQVNNMPDFDVSRLFEYYNARVDKANDTGASIRDGFKAVNQFGICSERIWPYITARFSVKPDSFSYIEALNHQSITYERIFPVTKESIMDVIARGFPVVYGKTLFPSFMTDRVAQTGIIPMPHRCEKEIGGHCMTVFDYDKDGTVELNSWGNDWGIQGTCHVPWEYVLKYGSDFWTMTLTE